MIITKIRNCFPGYTFLQKDQGWTLIELLVGIFMFFLIIGIGSCMVSSCIGNPKELTYDGKAYTKIDGKKAYNLVCLPDSGKIGGVCAGLGYKFGFDPVIARLSFIGICILGGAGMFGYLILWVVLDNARTPDDFETRTKG